MTVTSANGQNVSTNFAGKNYLINGAFDFNQRNVTSISSGGQYFADRWTSTSFSGTGTWSRENLAANSFPGQIGAYTGRITSTSATNDFGFQQAIEDVRTFAGQQVVVSLWVRTSTGTLNWDLVEFGQNFGSGGSASVYTYADASGKTYSTGWTRLTFTVTLPSVAGKTIGTGSFLWLRMDPASTIPNGTYVEFTHIQAENGITPTPFFRAAGNTVLEQQLCQKYYYRRNGATPFGVGQRSTTTNVWISIQHPVPMRITPAFNYSAVGDIQIGSANGSTQFSASSASVNRQNNYATSLSINHTTVDGATGNAAIVFMDNTNGWIDFNAELT